MGGWMDGRMTNISLKKKRACMHAYQNDTEQRERGKLTLKKKTSQNKQKNTVNSVANMQEYLCLLLSLLYSYCHVLGL